MLNRHKMEQFHNWNEDLGANAGKEMFVISAQQRHSKCKSVAAGTWAVFFLMVCFFVSLHLRYRPQNMRFPGLWMLRMPSIQVVSESNLWNKDQPTRATDLILQQLRINGTTPCHHVRTHRTMVLGLPAKTSDGPISILTDSPFTFLLVSVAANGTSRCSGGDFYETDLQGDHWRSRPPVVDNGNGTYSVTILVDRAFPGVYNFTAHLLFDNFHGLDQDPLTWAIIRKVVSFQFQLLSLNSLKKPAVISSTLALCRPEDLQRGEGSGRWTRGWFNESCNADGEGRFRCLGSEHERCDGPWCEGRVSLLESNGWVYSSECAFHLWERDEAWECLSGKWLFLWGDSNMQDVVRNLLVFVLGYEIPSWATLANWGVDRAVEQFFMRPNRPDQAIQISLVFNGHHETYNNGLGFDTLRNRTHRDWLLRHFNGSRTPDFFVMNGGLHDGKRFATVEDFAAAVDYVAEFWQNVFTSHLAPSSREEEEKKKRLRMVLRTAVTPAGDSRKLQSNPHKMEVFNAVMTERLKRVFGELHVVDAYDPTFPFHFDYSHSDGGHYGRAPKTDRWPWNGEPHHYFVDLMLVHMMLNSLCEKR